MCNDKTLDEILASRVSFTNLIFLPLNYYAKAEEYRFHFSMQTTSTHFDKSVAMLLQLRDLRFNGTSKCNIYEYIYIYTNYKYIYKRIERRNKKLETIRERARFRAGTLYSRSRQQKCTTAACSLMLIIVCNSKTQNSKNGFSGF